jgi:hypothetical protein
MLPVVDMQMGRSSMFLATNHHMVKGEVVGIDG